jgi:predicted transposase YdaD
MPKPFDAASKHLIESRPQDWLRLAGFPVPKSDADIRIVDADLSNVMTTAADKLIRVDNPLGASGPYLAHIEFQSSADSALDTRVLTYNVLIRRRHALPVWSAVFLLRPQALVPGVTGKVVDQLDEIARLDFSYHLVRVWELPTQDVLSGGLGILPLAPITAVTESELPPVIEKVRRRLAAEMPVQEGREFLLAMRVLMGLRYQEKLTESLMQSIAEMKDSIEWQKIYRTGKAEGKAEGVAVGMVEGERAVVIRQATQRFGTPPEAILRRITSIDNAEELSQLALKLLNVSSWDALFAD